MDDSYTRRAMDQLLDASESSGSDIWRIVDDTPAETTASGWKDLFRKIAIAFSCTPGYALLRILAERMKKLSPDQVTICTDPDDPDMVWITLTLQGTKGPVTFTNIPQGNSAALSKEDTDHLKSVLLLLASRQKDYTELRSEARDLINNALQSSKDYRTSLLSRPAAIELGHVLGLTLDEMQWFMLRVLEDRENFDYLSSSDLIDIYGFIVGGSLKDVRSWKKQYLKLTSSGKNTDLSTENSGSQSQTNPSGNSPKRRDTARSSAYHLADLIEEKELQREENFTRTIHSDFLSLAKDWAGHPDDRDEKMLDWLVSHSAELDAPSRSASLFYRMLAVYCYMHPAWNEGNDDGTFLNGHPDLVIRGLRAHPVEEPEELLSTLRRMNLTRENLWFTEMKKALYPDGRLDRDTCMKLAKAIYTMNMRELRYDSDNEKNYITLNVPSYGKAYPAGLRDPDHVSRIASLLLGIEPVEKRDAVSLLYLIYNCSWQTYTIEDSEERCDAVFAFEDGCRDILRKMCLPDLYMPHPMEQAMFLSIVDCMPGDEDDDGGSNPEMAASAVSGSDKSGSQFHDDNKNAGNTASPETIRDGVPASSYMRIMLSLKQKRNRR